MSCRDSRAMYGPARSTDTGDDFTKTLCSALSDIMKAEFTIPDLIIKNFSAGTGPDTKKSFVSEVNYDKDQLAEQYKEKLILHTALEQTENELMKAQFSAQIFCLPPCASTHIRLSRR